MTINERSLPQPIQLTVDTHRIAKLILIIAAIAEILFMVLDYHINFGEMTKIGGLRRMFNITREDSLASWFACTQTLMLGLTLGFIWICIKTQPDKRREALGWLILTCFFLYMAIDDGAQIHERFGSAFKKTMQQAGNTLDFFPSYTWQIVFLPVFVGLGLFTDYFLWNQVKEHSNRILLLVSIFCFGIAVGLDFIEGLDPDHPLNIYTWIEDNTDLEYWTQQRFDEDAYKTLRHFSKSLEEAIEMFAHTLIWFVVLRQIPTLISSIKIVFPT